MVETTQRSITLSIKQKIVVKVQEHASFRKKRKFDWNIAKRFNVRFSAREREAFCISLLVSISRCYRCTVGETQMTITITKMHYEKFALEQKVRKKDFLLCIEVQQIFSSPFSLLTRCQMPECFYVNNFCFWARATVLSWYRNWQCSQCGQPLRCSAIADKIKTIVSDKVNYRGIQS